MKKDLHPQWYNDAQITCACGNTFTTGSTHQSLQVEICAKCHPFFTGEMKFVDTQGRVEKFTQKRQQSAARRQELAQKQAEKNAKLAGEKNGATTTDPQSYRQILAQTQEQMKKDKKASLKTAKKTPVAEKTA